MQITLFFYHVVSPHLHHRHDFVDPVDMVLGIVGDGGLVLGLPGSAEEKVLGLGLLYGGGEFLWL